jgi:hypothetical protein
MPYKSMGYRQLSKLSTFLKVMWYYIVLVYVYMYCSAILKFGERAELKT